MLCECCMKLKGCTCGKGKKQLNPTWNCKWQEVCWWLVWGVWRYKSGNTNFFFVQGLGLYLRASYISLAI